MSSCKRSVFVRPAGELGNRAPLQSELAAKLQGATPDVLAANQKRQRRVEIIRRPVGLPIAERRHIAALFRR